MDTLSFGERHPQLGKPNVFVTTEIDLFRRDDIGGLRHIFFTGEQCWLFALSTGPVLKKNNLLWPCFEISCKLAPNVY